MPAQLSGVAPERGPPSAPLFKGGKKEIGRPGYAPVSEVDGVCFARQERPSIQPMVLRVSTMIKAPPHQAPGVSHNQVRCSASVAAVTQAPSLGPGQAQKMFTAAAPQTTSQQSHHRRQGRNDHAQMARA